MVTQGIGRALIAPGGETVKRRLLVGAAGPGALCVLIVLATGCPAPTPPKKPPKVDSPAPQNAALPETTSPVSLDGVPIPAADVNRRFAQRFQRANVAGADQVSAFRLKRAVIAELVDEALVREAATRRGLTVSATERDDALAAFGATFPSPASFERYMAGPNAADATRAQEILVLTRKLLGPPPAITDADVEAFYARNRVRFVRPAHRRGNEIVFIARPDADVVARVRDLRALRDRIAREGLSFAAMARAVSDAPSRDFGGDLGDATSQTLAPALWRALDGLAEGAMSEVVALDDRAVLLFGRERVPEVKRSLQEARPEILGAIEAARFSARRGELVSALRAAAKIEDRFTPRYAEFSEARFGPPAAGPAAEGPLRAGPGKPNVPSPRRP